MTQTLLRILCALSLLGCASEIPQEGPLVTPPFGDGKADVGDRVVDRGPLAFGVAVEAEIVEDLEFHGYTLAARPGAIVTLDVTQRGSSRSIDTSLFVYGPRSDAGGYGTEAIAFDDDAGWGRLSRLTRLELAAGGTYLVVVGTHDARGRGRYRLEPRCESGECAPLEPPPPAEGACPAAFAAAITACIDDHVENDPEWFYSMTRRDLVEQCADVEILAPAYDALCAGAAPPAELCALGLEGVAREHVPTCLGEAWNRELDEQCVFGDRYRDLFQPGALVVMARRELRDGAALDATEERQVIAAVGAASYEPTTVAEAFGSVDEGVVFQTELWDASNRRAFTAYEYGAGDNSYGLIFDHGVTRVAARIGDGDLYECTTTWGPEMRDCATSADCAEGLTCHGVAEAIGRGRCIDYRAPAHPAEESSCTLDAGCPAGSGLQCQGAATFGEGICRPAWLTGRFVTEPATAIPDRGMAEAQLVAYGLASVDVDVRLDLVVSHPRPADLAVTLINPAGAEVPIPGGASSSEIYLDRALVLGFSGDEAVNGVWTLRVEDRVSSRTGSIDRFGLTITSRWD